MLLNGGTLAQSPTSAADCKGVMGSSRQWLRDCGVPSEFRYLILLFQQSYEAGDYWDDEWDDDSEGGGTQAAAWKNNAVNSSGQVPKSGSAGDVSSIGVCTVVSSNSV